MAWKLIITLTSWQKAPVFSFPHFSAIRWRMRVQENKPLSIAYKQQKVKEVTHRIDGYDLHQDHVDHTSSKNAKDPDRKDNQPILCLTKSGLHHASTTPAF